MEGGLVGVQQRRTPPEVSPKRAPKLKSFVACTSVNDAEEKPLKLQPFVACKPESDVDEKPLKLKSAAACRLESDAEKKKQLTEVRELHTAPSANVKAEPRWL